MHKLILSVVGAGLLASVEGFAQEASRVVPYSGVVVDAAGRPSTGTAVLVFSIYEDETGSTPLWLETQIVELTAGGGYSVLLGATTGGLSPDLFGGEARWLGVTAGGIEAPRARIAWVPYALRAADADTLGGLPVTAFVQVPDVKSGRHCPDCIGGASIADSNVAPLEVVDEDLVVNGRLRVESPGPGAAVDIVQHGGTQALNIVGGTPWEQMVDVRNTGGGTTGRNYGMRLLAGSSATDWPLKLENVFGAPLMVVDGRGYVGIGTLAPGAQLHLDDPDSGQSMLQVRNHVAAGAFNGTYVAEIRAVAAGSQLNGVGIFLDEGSPTRRVLDIGSRGGTVASFGSSGLVGIGTATPTERLDVIGSIRVNGPGSGIVFGENRKQVTALATENESTAAGWLALNATMGNRNSAFGFRTLQFSTGGNNVAVGSQALAANTTGGSNVAVGSLALLANTSGGGNVAVGAGVLDENTIGSINTAIGHDSLTENTTGNYNTAVGSRALHDNTTANDNTAVGYRAASNIATGTGNTAVGSNAMSDTRGTGNTAIGHRALGNIFDNSGDGNIAIGAGAGSELGGGSGNIFIGHPGNLSSDHAIHIGDSSNRFLQIGSSICCVIAPDSIVIGNPNHDATYIAGIYGRTVSGGAAVVINSDGQLGTVSSSRRYKEDIADMGAASRALFALRPVTFRYRQADEDGSKPLEYGLIAEEVAEVMPDLVVTTDAGPDTVQYHKLAPLMLNELQRMAAELERLRHRVEELEAAAARR